MKYKQSQYLFLNIFLKKSICLFFGQKNSISLWKFKIFNIYFFYFLPLNFVHMYDGRKKKVES